MKNNMNEDKRERLYQGITEIDEDIIEEAAAEVSNFVEKTEGAVSGKSSKKRFPVKWLAIAACLCLVVVNVPNIMEMLGMGGRDSGGDGGFGHSDGSGFDFYYGPVFPLTTLEDTEGLEVSRNVDYDFLSYTTRQDGSSRPQWVQYEHAAASDSYVITNTTEEDITIEAIYPYVSTLRENLCPEITVDSAAVDAIVRAGDFRTKDTKPVWSYDWFSWEDYRDLLDDGTYIQEAFMKYPVLDEPVTVYELSEISDGGNAGNAVNPTLQFSFYMDPAETSVLTKGFDGGYFNEEAGEQSRNFSVSEEWRPYYGEHTYIIVRGKDIDGYTLQGFADGGCDPGEEIDGVTAKVDRYETTLDEILKIIARDYYDDRVASMGSGEVFIEEAFYDMFYGELCKSVMAEPKIDSSGSLEDMVNLTISYKRVLYSTFRLTIPAGESVNVQAKMYKNGSHDYGGDSGIMGYDMVTQLGSAFDFTDQTASISNTDSIEIIRQNFGFDIENDITSVKLDMAEEHYYMDIRLKE